MDEVTGEVSTMGVLIDVDDVMENIIGVVLLLVNFLSVDELLFGYRLMLMWGFKVDVMEDITGIVSSFVAFVDEDEE